MPAQAVGATQLGATQLGATHQWQRTGRSADGIAQQYVALDSIRPGEAEHQWIVDSYFTEHRLNGDVRADYVTLYDCDRHRYQDLNPGDLPSGDWGDAMADPLNFATMDFVCRYVGE